LLIVKLNKLNACARWLHDELHPHHLLNSIECPIQRRLVTVAAAAADLQRMRVRRRRLGRPRAWGDRRPRGRQWTASRALLHHLVAVLAIAAIPTGTLRPARARALNPAAPVRVAAAACSSASPETVCCHRRHRHRRRHHHRAHQRRGSFCRQEGCPGWSQHQSPQARAAPAPSRATPS
jgi:hypothetical protein